MKNFINYIENLQFTNCNINESKEDEYEKLFLELSHLNELEIKFDHIKYEDYIFYFYNENELFYQDKKNDYIYINYNEIWLIFERKFDLIYGDIQVITKKIVEKHFKLKDITTLALLRRYSDKVEKHFKLKDITTKGSNSTTVAGVEKHFKKNILK